MVGPRAGGKTRCAGQADRIRSAISTTMSTCQTDTHNMHHFARSYAGEVQRVCLQWRLRPAARMLVVTWGVIHRELHCKDGLCTPSRGSTARCWAFSQGLHAPDLAQCSSLQQLVRVSPGQRGSRLLAKMCWKRA